MKKKLISLALVLVMVAAVALPVFAAKTPPPEAPATGERAHEGVQAPELHRGALCYACGRNDTYELIVEQRMYHASGKVRLVTWRTIVCRTCGYQHFAEILNDIIV